MSPALNSSRILLSVAQLYYSSYWISPVLKCEYHIPLVHNSSASTITGNSTQQEKKKTNIHSNRGAGDDSVPWITREIKGVNPKGNQPWVFTERTNAEAGAPVLWPPDVKSWLTGKDPDAGKDWGKGGVGNRGWDGWIPSLTQRIWVWANSGRQWRRGKPGVLQSMGSQRIGHDLVTDNSNKCGISKWKYEVNGSK